MAPSSTVAPTAASFAGTVTANGPFTVGGTGDITLSGSVNGGNQVLTKIGNNTLTLSGTTDNNSLAVTVDSGTVVLAKTSSGLPSDVHAIGQDMLTVSGGTAQLGGTGGDQIFDLGSVTVTSGAFDTNGRNETFANLSLQGTGIGGSGALVNSAAAFSVITPTGGTTLTGNATIGVTQSTGELQLNSAIGGNFALAKAGSGTLLLAGNNTFTGGVTINAGTLQVGNPGALNSSSPNSVAFSSNSSGTLSLNGVSVTVSGLTTSATVGTPVVKDGSAASATLTVNNSAAEHLCRYLARRPRRRKLGAHEVGQRHAHAERQQHLQRRRDSPGRNCQSRQRNGARQHGQQRQCFQRRHAGPRRTNDRGQPFGNLGCRRGGQRRPDQQ